MSEICLSFLTRQKTSLKGNILDKIWSLDNWLSTLERVHNVQIISENSTYQHFILYFDADNSQLDRVEVERIYTSGCIEVTHLIPPPGILSLKGKWWVNEQHPYEIFASRQILLEKKRFTLSLAKKMFALLRENLEKLTKDVSCVVK
ncbi:hypothetical protein [Bartonella pachyuromydis]|uniref:Uncharacterized protein n=1 Tax=Bartonella pachyuromydis TaxID=931097 RepID=A0ABP8VPK4_9HYPH